MPQFYCKNAAGITKRVDYCKTRHNIKKKKCAFNQKALKNKTKNTITCQHSYIRKDIPANKRNDKKSPKNYK